MNIEPGNYHFSDWGSSFDDHPQYSLLKDHVERAVQDLFLHALRLQSEDFVYIFDSEKKVDDFCSRMTSYWESQECYEICAEIVLLREDLKKKWFDIPPVDDEQAMVIREWLKSSF
jgi:hypothetical protein